MRDNFKESYEFRQVFLERKREKQREKPIQYSIKILKHIKSP